MLQRLPVGMIAMIRLDNIVGPVQDWPRRETDRQSMNEINAARGGENIFDLHGREVVGTGREIKSLRGKTIEGWILAALILWLQIENLAELVWVKEPIVPGQTLPPNIKLQFKQWCSTMNITGGLSWANLFKVHDALMGKTLNIRGFFINEYDGGQYVSLILGPDLVHGEPAPVRFDYDLQGEELFISFVE